MYRIFVCLILQIGVLAQWKIVDKDSYDFYDQNIQQVLGSGIDSKTGEEKASPFNLNGYTMQ